MKVVRRHPAGRWLPSRRTFALFRLAALVRMRGVSREESDVFLAVDPGQSAFEQYTVGSWIFLTTICFIAAWLQRWIPLAAAVVCAIALSGWALQLPVYAVGLSLPGRNNQRLNSKVLFALLFAAAAWAITMRTWIFWPGALFFAAAALNAVAALVMLPLRRVVDSMERQCGI